MIDVDIEQQVGGFRLAVQFCADAPVVGLFGRSGAGKSTLVNAIAGILTPARGHIRVNGTSLFDAERGINLPPDQRRVGYVFQDALLFPHLDVETNLLYGRRLRRSTERFIEPPKVIDLLGIGGLLKRRPKTLSGGEKQRVAIGRALLAQPRMLLMDEPLAALDVSRKTEILDYIERLRDELHIPIVYVSHSVPEIARLADTVVLIEDGACVAVGDIETVMAGTDVKPANGQHEGGAIIATTVVAQDAAFRLTTLAFDGGELLVPFLDAPLGQRVRARIRARDVSVALQYPAQLSILNILRGRVLRIVDDSGPIRDVQIEVGKAVLTARITHRSFEQLALRQGQEVFALVKAVSFDQPSVGYA